MAEEQAKPTGKSTPWKECSPEARVERMRRVVRIQGMHIEELSAKLHELQRVFLDHQHNERGFVERKGVYGPGEDKIPVSCGYPPLVEEPIDLMAIIKKSVKVLE